MVHVLSSQPRRRNILAISSLLAILLLSFATGKLLTRKLSEESTGLPSFDVPGKDLPDVPRPPKFVRVVYTTGKESGKEAAIVKIKYLAEGDRFDEAYSFIKEALRRSRWTFLYERNTTETSGYFWVGNYGVKLLQETKLIYMKNSSFLLVIYLRLGEINEKTVTELEVALNPYSVTGAGELERYRPLATPPLIEEVAIFPGAVLYNQYVINSSIGVAKYDSYFIENATADTVEEFYLKNPPAGYALLNREISFGNIFLYYENRDTGSRIMIRISSELNPLGVKVDISYFPSGR